MHFGEDHYCHFLCLCHQMAVSTSKTLVVDPRQKVAPTVLVDHIHPCLLDSYGFLDTSVTGCLECLHGRPRGNSHRHPTPRHEYQDLEKIHNVRWGDKTIIKNLKNVARSTLYTQPMPGFSPDYSELPPYSQLAYQGMLATVLVD